MARCLKKYTSLLPYLRPHVLPSFHVKVLHLLLLSVLFAGQLAASDDTPNSIESWRAKRLERLTGPEGWLTLIGLHWLQPGGNTVGSAADNQIVLTAGPAHFGVVSLSGEGQVAFAPVPDPAIAVDGQPAHKTGLNYRDEEKATVVRAGTVSFHVIQRGGKIGLRVKDSASPRRTHFAGLDYFAVDPAWRITARWEPFEHPREIMITNVLGQTEPAIAPGRAVFVHDGQPVALLAIDEAPGEPLFFVISDQTSGNETYAASRFLYADRPQGGEIVLDFNRAYNPPCAFTPFATCPLPPRENRLPFPVRAGEKNTAIPRIEPLGACRCPEFGPGSRRRAPARAAHPPASTAGNLRARQLRSGSRTWWEWARLLHASLPSGSSSLP